MGGGTGAGAAPGCCAVRGSPGVMPGPPWRPGSLGCAPEGRASVRRRPLVRPAWRPGSVGCAPEGCPSVRGPAVGRRPGGRCTVGRRPERLCSVRGRARAPHPVARPPPVGVCPGRAPATTRMHTRDPGPRASLLFPPGPCASLPTIPTIVSGSPLSLTPLRIPVRQIHDAKRIAKGQMHTVLGECIPFRHPLGTSPARATSPRATSPRATRPSKSCDASHVARPVPLRRRRTGTQRGARLRSFVVGTSRPKGGSGLEPTTSTSRPRASDH